VISVVVDNLAPTAAVTVASEPLTDASPSTLVTFDFSEAIDPATFSIGDVAYDSTKGNLSGFTQVDSDTWTVTYTAIDGFDGSDTISVAAGAYADAAGNGGSAASDTVAIDRAEAPAFTANDDTVYISSGTNGATFSLSALLGNDVNTSGLTFTITGGDATYNASTQMITLTSANPAPFTYELDDGTSTDSATVTVNVEQVTGGADEIDLSAFDYAASYIDLGNNTDTFIGSTVIGSISEDTIFGGNAGDDLSGNEGNDSLAGQGGSDTLNGGAGADKFVFATALTGTNSAGVDTIEDFDASGSAASGDKIVLDDAVFAGFVGQTTLTAAQFHLNGAVGTGAQLVFNTTTGALFYDTNGTGGGGATQIATLTVLGLSGTLDATDFGII
jgi:Ca2+-binding RTX toxin-like protein